MKQDFTDLKPYLKELSKNKEIANTKNLADTYSNSLVWDDLACYPRKKWQLVVGFTEMPRQFVLRGKVTLLKYVLAFTQEMDKDQIDYAPGLEAGAEVQRVYKTLGCSLCIQVCPFSQGKDAYIRIKTAFGNRKKG